MNDNDREQDRQQKETRSLSESCDSIPVSEIMITDVVVVSENDPIEHVLELMATKTHHSYPVIGENGELEGIVNQNNMLERLFFERVTRQHHTHLMAIRALSEDARTLMNQHPVSISHDTSLCEAVDLMIKHHIDRICVTKDGKFAGIISKADIIKKVFMLRRME